jgi:hypothetical protein
VRILITGGRNWTDYTTINDAILDASMWQDVSWWPDFDPATITIVHGDAKGADTIAGGVARMFGMTEERHPANWETHHRAAGPIRNQEMVDLGADLCLAFLMPGSKGTADCVRRAEKAGIEVRKYYSEQV